MFSSNNYNVVGIEISDIAFDLAKKFDPNTKFYHGDVMDIPYDKKIYDAIYSFNVLHLFRDEERKIFLNKCFNKLKEKGFIFFTSFSEKENSFGKGKEVEKNTFESKPNRPVHYFTKKDLIKHFKRFKIIETGIIKDTENHGQGLHTHRVRYIFGQKI